MTFLIHRQKKNLELNADLNCMTESDSEKGSVHNKKFNTKMKSHRPQTTNPKKTKVVRVESVNVNIEENEFKYKVKYISIDSML